jgi:hypothetical protein
MTTIQQSQTYETILSGTQILHRCESGGDTPYLLRMAGMTLSPDAADLYKKVWDISRCLQDPAVLTSQLREITHLEYPVEKALVVYSKKNAEKNEKKTKDSWAALLQEGIYTFGADYLFLKPSHTPLYDKWTEFQKKTKQYSRAYYQLQFLSIDITDELLVFQQKFQQAMYTTFHIHSSLGMLTADVIGGLYGGNDVVLMIEGIYQVTHQIGETSKLL